MLCIYFNGTQMHILLSIIVMSTGNFLTCYFPLNSYSDRLDILWGQSPRSIYICVPLNALEIKSVVNVDQEYCKSKRYLSLSPKLHPSRWCLTRKVLISSESGTVKNGRYIGNVLSSLLLLPNSMVFFSCGFFLFSLPTKFNMEVWIQNFEFKIMVIWFLCFVLLATDRKTLTKLYIISFLI